MDILPTTTTPLRTSDDELRKWIRRLLAGPRDPRQAFVIAESSYAALYAMAAHIQACCGGADAPPVCLCAQDKAVVAAALLASLAGGPAMILPYAFNTAVLDELHLRTGFRMVVSDQSRPVPPGTRCMVPAAGQAAWPSIEALAPRRVDAEWVRLFTGGSTDTPKMWTKTVRNLMAETLSIIASYDVSAEDRLVATVAPYHIYGLLYAVLTPLLASASVASQTPSFPGEIEAVVRQGDATILISVPAHYRALNGHSFVARSLRLAFSSAGMLAAEDAADFSAQTGAPIAEIYGSTETGGIASRVRVQGQTDFGPCAGIVVRVAGERLKVRSDYLSPELALQPDGYFVMGDRVKATVGNRFELLGRADGVVKVGGQRVDLEAVRQCLKKHPGVKDAVAISLPVAGGRENQIMALIEADGATVDVGTVSLDTLAPYARPRGIKVVSKIPVTAAGKYDRKTIEGLLQLGGQGRVRDDVAGRADEKNEE